MVQVVSPQLWGGRTCPEVTQTRACWGTCLGTWAPLGWGDCTATDGEAPSPCGDGVQTRTVRWGTLFTAPPVYSVACVQRRLFTASPLYRATCLQSNLFTVRPLTVHLHRCCELDSNKLLAIFSCSIKLAIEELK